MDRPAEPVLAFRTLHESPLVSVQVFTCRACRGGPAAEERSGSDGIVLLHRGAFRKHLGTRSVTSDVNQATFFSRDVAYRVSHPADCGDRGSLLRTSPRVLADIIREVDPSVDDRPDRPFPFVTGPCETDVYWRHHELVTRMEWAAERPPEALWADVAALQLVADVVEAAFRRHGLARPARRVATEADHAEMTEAAKVWLAGRLGERVTLEDVAAAVHASPWHFARIFQRQSGVPVHRYLTRLRLRSALERLAEGADDLGELALQLGFSSHAHFTDSFRREFGQAPSDVRRTSRARRLREMSKHLEA